MNYTYKPDPDPAYGGKRFIVTLEDERTFDVSGDESQIEALVQFYLNPPSRPPYAPQPVNDIHMAWFRVALAEAGKLAAVDAAIASLDAVKQTLWEYATSIRIDDPDVIAVASALNIDLRATFDRAAAIRQERQPIG